ncbi:hypothetical protein D8M23_04645 [Rothia sp. HSID18067]|uniref:hypothetical protein n=1 Tax=Rothia TaxID=32207 RepID=UPI000F86CDF4|nr:MULTISPECIES: hypothetical protein [Rothia]RUP74740.1 hypothetical protein D8M23_04645 [Rothia sp. HSID18067]
MFGCKKRKKDYTELTTNLQNISGDLVRLNHTVQNDSQVNCKETKKESKNLLENIDKILKIISVYLAIWGALNIFLWASYISSWNLADTAFIIQQEGISGGVSRMFALIVSYAIMILISFASLIVFIGFPIIFGKWVYEKLKSRIDRRYYFVLCIFCVIASIFLLAAIYLTVVFIYKNILYMDDSPVDGYFDYWVNGEDFVRPFIIVSIAAFCIAMIKFFFWDRHKLGGKKEVGLYGRRVFLIYLAIVLAIFPIFVFSGVYSKGYGTECISLEVEDSVIKGSGMNNAEGKEGKLKPSWAIQSGGKDIADILDKNKGNNTYVLASYVYSEDKDYLNIMVFSIRELYKDTEGKTRAKSDLLISENGEGKSGVLVSIKKSSIAGRYPSNPLCFKGDS